MAGIPFVTQLEGDYGQVVQVSPLLRRVLARNPSKYTFKGTGTYIVGRGRVAIVDCGPRDDEHVEALLRAVEGETVTHLLVTHTHGDHSPATAVLREVTGAPSYGFGPHPPGATEEGEGEGEGEGSGRDTADREFVPDVAVGDGDVIRGDGFTFECLHTPGHISNHVCYALAEERALFTGDHVMGWSTTVIPPPDGDMEAYLANLERLLSRDDEVYYPTHGPPIPDPKPFVAALIEHRRERERQILDHLRLGPTTIPDMVRVLYTDVREELHRPAARSVLAHLLPLVRQGVVACSGDGSPGEDRYWLASAGPTLGR